MRVLRNVLPICALLVAGSAQAQANPDSIKRRNDCRLAAQVLRTGHPAPHRDWAHAMIGYCGREQWANAASAAIRRLSGSTDERELAAEWRHLWMLRDSAVFETIRDIAADRSASAPARLWALRTLATYIDPEGVYGSLTEIVANAPSGRPACISNRAAGAPEFREDRPLPSDYADRARHTAETIMKDESEGQIMRAAAMCVQAAPVYGIGVHVAQ
jgi:hypothetical protein